MVNYYQIKNKTWKQYFQELLINKKMNRKHAYLNDVREEIEITIEEVEESVKNLKLEKAAGLIILCQRC